MTIALLPRFQIADTSKILIGRECLTMSIPMSNSMTLSDFWGRFRHALHRDRSIYTTIAGAIAMVVALSAVYSIESQLALMIYLDLFVLMGACLLIASVVFYFFYLAYNRHPHPLSAYWEKLRSIIRAPHEIIAFFLLMVSLSISFSAFTSLKSMIPVIVPYQFDPLFAHIDRLIHFGVDPWIITHTIFDHPIATSIINFLYNLWFFICWSVLIFFMIPIQSPGLRKRYLVSFLLCWIIIGGLLATMMSSVGPCFYYEITGADDFLPLTHRLAIQDQWLGTNFDSFAIWAVDTQQNLWNLYAQRQTALGSGISAMPSMHVSIAVLMALGMGGIDKRLAVPFWLYAAIILVGSVHLAWHYAIDGYLAAVLTLVIWRFTQRLGDDTEPGRPQRPVRLP